MNPDNQNMDLRPYGWCLAVLLPVRHSHTNCAELQEGMCTGFESLWVPYVMRACRREKNRASAQQSRQRKKCHLEALEQRVEQLEKDRQALQVSSQLGGVQRGSKRSMFHHCITR